MKIGQYFQRLNCDGVRDYFEWIFLVDVVVEEDSIKMIDFVLEDDCIKTKGFDFDIFASKSVVGFDGDFVGSISVSRMLSINA